MGDVRPAITLQLGTPRLVWRGSYLFAGSLRLARDGVAAYSNHASLGLATQPTDRTLFTLVVGATQGGTAFRMSQPAAEAGQPGFRAEGDPSLVTGTLSQGLDHEISPVFRMGQSLTGAWAGLQSRPEDGNGTISAQLRADRAFARETVGVAFGLSYAALRPLEAPRSDPRVRTLAQSFLATWSRDLDERWSGRVGAGLELLRTEGVGSSARTTGGLVLHYAGAAAGGSVSYQHAATPSLERGTIAESDTVLVQGTLALDPSRERLVSASAGYVRAGAPEGPVVAPGPSEAFNGDFAITFNIGSSSLVTARYSMARQVGGPDPATIHLVFLGFTVRAGNVERMPPVPTRGSRVDRSDAVGFAPEGSRSGNER